ncbi:MAG: hypothetical protein WDN44_03070 [Sphingomonas sp.]
MLVDRVEDRVAGGLARDERLVERSLRLGRIRDLDAADAARDMAVTTITSPLSSKSSVPVDCAQALAGRISAAKATPANSLVRILKFSLSVCVLESTEACGAVHRLWPPMRLIYVGSMTVNLTLR